MRSIITICTIIFSLIPSVDAIDSMSKEELLRAGLFESTNTNKGLAKNASPTATSYNSSYFNVSYTCPTGWTITAFDSTPNTFSLTVTKSLRSNIHINGRRLTTTFEASAYNYVSLFTTAKIAFNASNGKMPGIYSIWDTTYTTGINSVGINMKYALDANNVYQSQCFNASESKSNFQHEIWYFTTVSDYVANNTEYSQHWLNLTFGTTALSKQVAVASMPSNPFVLTNNTLKVTADQQKQLKLDLFDLLGKRIMNIYNSGAGQQNVINLDNAISAPSNYVIKATTTNGSTYHKVFIK